MKKLIFVGALLCLALVSCEKIDEFAQKNKDKCYIIISDVHLADQRAVDGGYGWNLTMRDTLCSFLDYLIKDGSWDELVFAGDLFEEWNSLPQQTTLADKDGKAVSEEEYFKILVDHNSVVFDKLRQLKAAGHKIVYIPGNHDMQTTASDFNKHLSGLFDQARSQGIDGMGEYQPSDELFIEHGHRYDILNSPYIGKSASAGDPSLAGSILPPGFFVTKLYAGGVKSNSAPNKSILGLNALDDVTYNVYWEGCGAIFGKDSIMTAIDKMEGLYGFEDYACSDAKLFNGVDKADEPNDGWTARCKRVGAQYVPSVTTSILCGLDYDVFDQMGLHVLSKTSFKPHILVWGHSHSPKLMTSFRKDNNLERVIYLNVGSWVDSIEAGKDCTSTFGKVIKSKNNKYQVSLCRFDISSDGQGTVSVLGSETLL